MGRLDALEPRERLLSPPRPPSCPQPDAVRGIARDQAHGTGRVRLTGLTGVQPTDRLDDDELTSRFCRDCPRLTVKPVHALIVVLLLCCGAACTSRNVPDKAGYTPVAAPWTCAPYLDSGENALTPVLMLDGWAAARTQQVRLGTAGTAALLDHLEAWCPTHREEKLAAASPGATAARAPCTSTAAAIPMPSCSPGSRPWAWKRRRAPLVRQRRTRPKTTSNILK